MTNLTLSITLSGEQINQIDGWRREVEPVVDRATAAQQLVEIALNDHNFTDKHVSEEVVDTVAGLIAGSMYLESAEPVEMRKLARHLHEEIQGLGLLLGIEFDRLAVAVEMLQAIREVPDSKN